MTRNEALRDQQACRLRGETRAPIGIGLPLARHRQPLGPLALIRLRGQRRQPLARIQPAHVQAAGMQVRRTDGGRQQLALPQHLGLPVQRAHCSARVAQQRMQCGQSLAQHRIGVQFELGQKLTMALVQCRHALCAIGGAVGNGGELVGHARQCRHHHQHATAGLVRPFARQFSNRVPAMTTRHRSAAELEDDPTIGRVGS